MGMRKNGLIINGTPKKPLTEVLNNSGEVIGYEFIEINALNKADKIIIHFPGGVSGEIYLRPAEPEKGIEGRIILKGFEIE